MGDQRTPAGVMKKLACILLLGIFLINLASADIFTPSTWDDKLTFHEESKNGKYGYYEINDTTFWLFNNKPIKTIELIENEYSVFTAWNIKEIEVFKESKLFDKTNYLDKEQKNDRSNLINSELHLYREWETKTRIINNQECSNYETSINGTETCLKWLDASYEENYKGWSNWKLYNFQTVKEGLYQTKTIVTRKNHNTGVIDWVDENEGHSLNEWATWWDFNWVYKREISNLTGNLSALFTITWDSNMQADFDDLRFLDTATESIELNYTIENYTASSFAIVRVFNQGENSIQMYYGNAIASTTESASDTYFKPTASYYLDRNAIDFINGNNGSITGATSTVGYINGSYNFNGGTDRIEIIENANITSNGNPISICAWINSDTGTGEDTFIYKQNDYYMRIDGTNKLEAGVWGINAEGNAASSGVWVFACMVYDGGSSAKLYRNGVSVANGTGSSSQSAGSNLLIGYRASYAWDGKIDEVLIYPYALTQNRIIKLYTQNEPNFIEGSEKIAKGVSTTLIYPENNQNILNNTVTFNFTSIPTDTNLTNTTLYIWWSNGTLKYTNFTILSGNESVNTTFINTLVDGTYKYNAETCGENVNCSFATLNNSFIVHVTPIKINISEPNGTIEYIKVGNNQTLRWTLTEIGENLTEHVTNCSYTYNSVITYLSLNNCILTNVTNFTYVLGVNNLTFNTTDKFNLTSNQTTIWNYKIIEINQTFNNETLEGAAEELSAIIKLGTGQSITAAALIYNNTIAAGTNIPAGENTKIQIKNFIIPQVTTDTNITFYWSIVLSGGEIINLSSQNQTIRNIALDNCSSFSNQILNITMVDEEIQTLLSNTTIEVAINLLSVDRTKTVVSLSGSFEDENPLGICLSENITEDIMYSLDAIFKYTSNGYAIEYYNLVDSPLDNDTTTQSITLYNLNASDSTDFQLTFTGEDYLPVENALVFIERQYIAENTFKTVELPKTDSNGQTILHLVRNDIVYNIRVVKNGITLGLFNNIIAFCEDFTIGACSLPLNAISNISLVFNYDDEIGLIFQENTQYNETTGLASFSFASTDGTTKVVNMRIERRDVFGNRSICENTLVSPAGSVSCQVDPAISDTSLISIISVDGEDKINSEIIIDSTAYGQNGYAMFFIFAVGMFLMFSGSKTWTLIGVSLEYIVGVSLGQIIGGIAGDGSTGIFILIISVVGIWQLNKERKQ